MTCPVCDGVGEHSWNCSLNGPFTPNCDHDWREVESMFTNEYRTEVRCAKCHVTGERDESDGSVFWPAT
jgi:hypothetical protein